MKVLSYIAHGAERYVREAHFSVLSALSFIQNRHEWEIVVWTDQPSAFSGLDLRVEVLTPDVILQPSGYAHRLKLILLRRLLMIRQVPCVLLDTDTLFTGSPEVLFQRIAPGQAILHDFEGRLSEEPFAISSGVLPQLYEAVPSIGPDAEMWNSGVIGLHPNDMGSLDEALLLCDRIFAATKFRTAEQLALSEVLRANVSLTACADAVFHYWDDWVDPITGTSQRQHYNQQVFHFLRTVSGRALDAQIAAVKKLTLTVPRPTFAQRLVNLGAKIRPRRM